MSSRPTRHHLVRVARELKSKLNGRAFITMDRMEVTELLRGLSEQEGTRIKSQLASELEQVLLEEAVRCYPSLKDTTTGDTIRLFHAGTVFGNLVNLLIYPSKEDDKDLGDMLSKIKNKWRWSTPNGPAAEL